MEKPVFDYQKVKHEMLNIILNAVSRPDEIFVLTARALGFSGRFDSQPAHPLILTVWYDLFREGILSPGMNFDNPNLPHYHLTERGQAAIAQVSRDPANPAGYMANLKSIGELDAVVVSYIDEGLKAYNTGCYRATAVMVGCAAESLILKIRSFLVAKLESNKQSVPKELKDWRMKVVLDQLETEIENRRASMERLLYEQYSGNWQAFTSQIRMTRNEGGHPVGIDSVTVDTAHSSLLIFPQLARLALQLLQWIKTSA